MVDGTYEVSLKSPMGLKKGELKLHSEGGVLSGGMTVMGKENPIGPGTAEGDNFSFSGELKTAVGKLAYMCEGRVEGNAISGVAKTKKGDLPLTGKRK